MPLRIRRERSMIYDAAIVGCGPVGALAANLLGRAGLSVLILERERALHPLPRATHLDHEIMRLLQDAGLAGAAQQIMRETDGHLHVGADHGVIRYMGTRGAPRSFGWANDYFFFQPELEACLRAGLAGYPNVHLQMDSEVHQLTQGPDDVELVSSRGRARARYVIACDGAKSLMRKALGVGFDDYGFEETWLVVDAEVHGEVKFPPIGGLPAEVDLQSLSTMMCDPTRPTTLVPGPRNLRRWEFMLLPGEDEAKMSSEPTVAALVAPWLTGVPHRILRAATYQFHGLIADRWQVGRVFLAGDAAHQTPPFFGQGMCHGMRDVANLAWKLKLVLAGAASEGLLASYQTEREPHVRAITSAAIDAGRYICLLDPMQAAERDSVLRERMRHSGRQTAADLVPAICAGIVCKGAAGAGERFIQPRLGGILLDDLVGTGWRLFTMQAPAADVSMQCLRDPLSQLQITLVNVSTLHDAEPLADWLRARNASCVLVRPDFYVFGTGTDPASLLEELAGILGSAAGSIMAHPSSERITH